MKSLITLLAAIATVTAFALAGPSVGLLCIGLAVAAFAPSQTWTQKVKQLAVPLMLGTIAHAYVVAGFHAAVLVTFLCLAGLAASPRAMLQLGAAPDTNAIDSSLQITEILDGAITTFSRAMVALRMFCSVFQNVPLKGDGTVRVPYYPLQGITSKDFNGTYSFATGEGSNTAMRSINVSRAAGGKRKYQPLQATSEEIAQQPLLNLQKLGEMKGEKLAYDIIQDVLSVVTAANFGPAAFTGASSGFDSDDIVDIGTVMNKNAITSVTDGVTNTDTSLVSATAFFTENDIGVTVTGTNIPASTTIASVTNRTTVVLSAATTGSGTGITVTIGRPPCPWPEIGRGMLLNADYNGALMKDTAVKAAYALGADSVIKEGKLPRVLGFDYAFSPAIPGNSENLVGFVAYMSAILFAQAPVPPADQGNIVDYRIVVDPVTGIALEYREWFDASTDTLKRVIEANYGYAKGEGLALKRLVSA